MAASTAPAANVGATSEPASSTRRHVVGQAEPAVGQDGGDDHVPPGARRVGDLLAAQVGDGLDLAAGLGDEVVVAAAAGVGRASRRRRGWCCRWPRRSAPAPRRRRRCRRRRPSTDSITAVPPLKLANSTSYGAPSPCVGEVPADRLAAGLLGDDELVAVGDLRAGGRRGGRRRRRRRCRRAPAAVDAAGATAVVEAAGAVVWAAALSSSDEPHAAVTRARARTAQGAPAVEREVMVVASVRWSGGQVSTTPSSASRRRRRAVKADALRVRGRGMSTATSSEMRPSVSTTTRLGEQDRLVDVVGDEQRRPGGGGRQLLQQAVHADAGEGVEGAERLVEQQQLGLARRGPGPARPAGPRRPTACAASAGPGRRGRPRRARRGRARRRRRGQADDDVAQHPLPRQQARLLEHDRPALGHAHAPVTSPSRPPSTPQQRALARAAAPEQGDELAGRHVEVEAVEDDVVAERLAQPVDDDGRW